MVSALFKHKVEDKYAKVYRDLLKYLTTNRLFPILIQSATFIGWELISMKDLQENWEEM